MGRAGEGVTYPCMCPEYHPQPHRADVGQKYVEWYTPSSEWVLLANEEAIRLFDNATHGNYAEVLVDRLSPYRLAQLS